MKYYPAIGIETHVQLKTATKLFASVGNDAREAQPNTLISHICVGLPGALPYLNRAALELSAKAAFALNTKPQKFSKFDRKHYFYPDLPKGYQISQYDQPIILGGYLEIPCGDKVKKISITRAHLEEDAGKNTHPAGADYSLVDLNRAGTPLLEIVSEPEMASPEEAKAYAREIYLTMKLAGVSDCDLYHGNIRFDVNISLSSKPGSLGTRSEIKNLNSFRAVENAVAYEIKRQTELLEKGQTVVQETRGWDDAKQKTISQRGKEEAHDYRYMPEPDVPPIELDNAFIEKMSKQMPKMPKEIRADLSSSGLDGAQIETILDNDELAETYTKAINMAESPEVARLWSQGATNNKKIREAMLDWKESEKEGLLKNSLAAASATLMGKINSNQFNLSLEQIAINRKQFSELNFTQISDPSEIDEIVKQVLSKNPKAVDDIAKGELKAIGFLVGQVMALSKGQANPEVVQKIIKKQLGL